MKSYDHLIQHKSSTSSPMCCFLDNTVIKVTHVFFMLSTSYWKFCYLNQSPNDTFMLGFTKAGQYWLSAAIYTTLSFHLPSLTDCISDFSAECFFILFLYINLMILYSVVQSLAFALIFKTFMLPNQMSYGCFYLSKSFDFHKLFCPSLVIQNPC